MSRQIKFFMNMVGGIIAGTILHEIYHYAEAILHNGNPKIIFVGYGVGIKSSYHSSEIIAFVITAFCVLLSFFISIRRDYEKMRAL